MPRNRLPVQWLAALCSISAQAARLAVGLQRRLGPSLQFLLCTKELP
jgi:hypothetical protein